MRSKYSACVSLGRFNGGRMRFILVTFITSCVRGTLGKLFLVFMVLAHNPACLLLCRRCRAQCASSCKVRRWPESRNHRRRSRGACAVSVSGVLLALVNVQLRLAQCDLTSPLISRSSDVDMPFSWVTSLGSLAASALATRRQRTPNYSFAERCGAAGLISGCQ